MIMNFLSVAVGGALGAMARYGVGLALSSGYPSFIATLSVNVVGCALMGVMAASFSHVPFLQGAGRSLIMVGFLGALTTFSSFAFDSFTLLEKQQYGVMIAYMTASFCLSLAAFFLLYHLTKWGLS